MCGFFSIYSPDKIDPSIIQKARLASKSMFSRGPDDSFEFIDNNYASFFYRLAIRDLTTKSRQPFISNSKKHIISYNGEIYSFKDNENKNNLCNSDTIQLGNYLDKYGEDSFNKIRGMFAICVYDIKNKKVTITRDSLGIKPLFFTDILIKGSKLFIFSSTQRAIIDFMKFPLNDDQIFRYLKMGISCDNKDTFFKGIQRLIPGTLLNINSEGKMVFKNLKTNLKEFNLKINKEYKKEEHREMIYKTFKEHLISDIPVSTTISGGIDSTFLSCFTANETETESFTLESDLFKSEEDDLSSIKNLKNLNISKIKTSNQNIPLTIRKIINILKSPFAHSSWIFQFQLFEKIKSINDCKVLLVGEGADEIYSGYKRMLYPYLLKIEREYGLDFVKKLSSSYISFMGINEEKILENYSRFKLSLNEETDYECQNFERICFEKESKIPYERYMPKSFNQDEKFLYYKSMLMRYITRSDIPSTLEILDSISMENSIELRVPYLDIDLISYVFSIDSWYHFQNGFNKYILRDAAKILPNDIRWRKNKKQRPSSTYEVMKNYCFNDMVNLLQRDNKYFDSKKARNYFCQDMQSVDKNNASFWFRIYTFMIFLDLNR